MAVTLADRDRLLAALATGTLECEIDGKRHRYRDVGQIKEALEVVDAELAKLGLLPSSNASTERQSFATWCRS